MLRGDEILSTPRAIATPGESKLSSGLSEENETEDEEYGPCCGLELSAATEATSSPLARGWGEWSGVEGWKSWDSNWVTPHIEFVSRLASTSQSTPPNTPFAKRSPAQIAKSPVTRVPDPRRRSRRRSRWRRQWASYRSIHTKEAGRLLGMEWNGIWSGIWNGIWSEMW